MRALRRRGVAFGFKLVGELAELVEIDAWLEAERMWRRSRRRNATRPRDLPEACPDRPIDGFLERYALLACTLLQKAGKIVVYGQCRPHGSINSAAGFDVNTSAIDVDVAWYAALDRPHRAQNQSTRQALRRSAPLAGIEPGGMTIR
jgi:hypothetical protein